MKTGPILGPTFPYTQILKGKKPELNSEVKKKGNSTPLSDKPQKS